MQDVGAAEGSQLDAGSSAWKYLKCTPLTEHQTALACAVKFTQTMAAITGSFPNTFVGR